MPNPSRETKFSGTNADREIFIFHVHLTTSRIGNLARLMLPLVICVMTIHPYIKERRTGNNLPAAMISVARIRTTQLQWYLVTGKEPSESTIQATLDLISLGQDTSDLANLADKVSTVSHMLECASNQTNRAGPAQINSSSRGRTPTPMQK